MHLCLGNCLALIAFTGDIKPHNILLKKKSTKRFGSSSSPMSPLESHTDSKDGGEGGLDLDLDWFELKISDMGLSRETPGDAALSSFSLHSSTCSTFRAGTLGWAAPEVYNKGSPHVEAASAREGGGGAGAGEGTEELPVVLPRDYFAMDIFSLGCVFHFLMDTGRPFPSILFSSFFFLPVL
jgi:serine/threonine protein kinase